MKRTVGGAERRELAAFEPSPGARQIADSGASGRPDLLPGPWRDHLKGGARAAAEAYLAQIAAGHDAVGTGWRGKLARLVTESVPTKSSERSVAIAGTISGTGPGNIVDRVHESLDTSRLLVRSFDANNEAIASEEYRSSAPPLSAQRIGEIVDRELERLDSLGAAAADPASGLRTPKGQDQVADRRLFALGRAAQLVPNDGALWLGIKFRTAPGREPSTIHLHAKLRGDDYRLQETAIEMLGINLLHGAYYDRDRLIEALGHNLPSGVVDLDWLECKGPAFDDARRPAIGSEPPPPDPVVKAPFPHPPMGSDHKALRKAQRIANAGDSIGVAAEIGAGQLVSEVFWRTPGGDETLVERVSNYGMEMSGFIYGARDRAVSKGRAESMLDHEYASLEARAKRTGVDAHKRLFAFATTVATRPDGPGAGWIGVTFQPAPGRAPEQVLLHVRLLSETVPEQEQALKMMGMNLILAARAATGNGQRAFIDALTDEIDPSTVQIDHIETKGGRISDWSSADLNLELLESGSSPAVLYAAGGKVEPIFERYYGRALLVRPEHLPGEARDAPVTSEDAAAKLAREPGVAEVVGKDPAKQGTAIVLYRSDFPRGRADLEARASALSNRGFDVLVMRHHDDYALARLLAETSNKKQALLLTPGAAHRLFDRRRFAKVEGHLEGAFAHFPAFDGNVSFYVLGRDVASSLGDGAAKRAYQALEKRGVLVELSESRSG
jgi:hypothetical protein